MLEDSRLLCSFCGNIVCPSCFAHLTSTTSIPYQTRNTQSVNKNPYHESARERSRKSSIIPLFSPSRDDIDIFFTAIKSLYLTSYISEDLSDHFINITFHYLAAHHFFILITYKAFTPSTTDTMIFLFHSIRTIQPLFTLTSILRRDLIREAPQPTNYAGLEILVLDYLETRDKRDIDLWVLMPSSEILALEDITFDL